MSSHNQGNETVGATCRSLQAADIPFLVYQEGDTMDQPSIEAAPTDDRYVQICSTNLTATASFLAKANGHSSPPNWGAIPLGSLVEMSKRFGIQLKMAASGNPLRSHVSPASTLAAEKTIIIGLAHFAFADMSPFAETVLSHEIGHVRDVMLLRAVVPTIATSSAVIYAPQKSAAILQLLLEQCATDGERRALVEGYFAMSAMGIGEMVAILGEALRFGEEVNDEEQRAMYKNVCRWKNGSQRAIVAAYLQETGLWDGCVTNSPSWQDASRKFPKGEVEFYRLCIRLAKSFFPTVEQVSE
ncbi:MAG: hypothetical protein HYV03_06675 [Deltaproteobacteria bacterium]|nr:hypothetical protein [Deltaproteobacteria bacterium]